jgi:hypothetical protein
VLEVELLALPHPATASAVIARATSAPTRNFTVLKVTIICSQLLISSQPAWIAGYL